FPGGRWSALSLVGVLGVAVVVFTFSPWHGQRHPGSPDSYMRHIICDMAERLETSWLELLVLVGETGSLTAAADILGMAQPNASRRLSLLERRLGVKLFVRGARGSEPTPAGTVAINRAARVLEEIDALVEETQSVAGSGAARIMASQTISEYLMPEFLAALSATEPGIRSEEHTSELQSRFDLVCRLLLEKKKKANRNTQEQSPTH